MNKRSAMQQIMFDRPEVKAAKEVTRKRIPCAHCRRFFETEASLAQHFADKHQPEEFRLPGEEGGDGDWYNDSDMGAR